MPAHPLTAEQIAHYRREGYVVAPALLGPADLAAIDATIQTLVDRAAQGENMSQVLELEPQQIDGRSVPRRIYNPYDQHEDFRRLAHDARICDAIESLIGPDFNLQHSKLNMKPARVGSPVEWHQDLAYFPHTNDDLVTTLVYLDDATVENGCLQVLARHQHHFFDHFGPDGSFLGMIAEDLGTGRFGRPVPLEAPAGSVIFMHCITPHSSLPNCSEKPRRTLIFEYRAADSFPIWYGPQTATAEARLRQVRGRESRVARFGGPPPLVPTAARYASLYELQERSKARAAGEPPS